MASQRRRYRPGRRAPPSGVHHGEDPGRRVEQRQGDAVGDQDHQA